MAYRALFAAAALTLTPLAIAPAAFAQAPESVYTKKNVAVGGYDPVAYFTVGEATKGDDSFTSTYNGAEYRFSSADNKATFDANPAAYLPEYGGYCAWAVAQGKTAPGNGKHWAIVDGKLYLNYNGGVQKKWNADRDGFIASADEKFPVLFPATPRGQGSDARPTQSQSGGQGYGS